jgi:hypothetical protein
MLCPPARPAYWRHIKQPNDCHTTPQVRNGTLTDRRPVSMAGSSDRGTQPSDQARVSWVRSTAFAGTMVEMVCLYTICVVALFSTTTY